MKSRFCILHMCKLSYTNLHDFVVYFFSEILYESSDGAMLPRVVCESLAPKLWVDADIINIWSMILNKDQLVENVPISRLFMTTLMIVSCISKFVLSIG
jgi:hypothetical protein